SGIRTFLALSVSSRSCAIFRIRRLHSSLFSRLLLVHPLSCGLMAYCLRSPFTSSALGSDAQPCGVRCSSRGVPHHDGEYASILVVRPRPFAARPPRGCWRLRHWRLRMNELTARHRGQQEAVASEWKGE